MGEDSERESPPDTEELLAHLDSEPLNWELLLRRVESRLRVLLHFKLSGLVRGTCEPDDVLQEVWIEAHRKVSEFEYRGPGSLQRWMARILERKLVDQGRTALRVAIPASVAFEGTSDPCHEPSAGLAAGLAGQQPGVTTTARQRELEARVREVLEELPPADRESILLRLYMGLTFEEIGERLRVDPSTASKRFQRAIERCRVPLDGFA